MTRDLHWYWLVIHIVFKHEFLTTFVRHIAKLQLWGIQENKL